MHIPSLLTTLLPLFPLVSSQLADRIAYPLGPLTSSSTKWTKKVCDVTNYGAVADGKTDFGPALLSALNACKAGGVVNIPTATFAMTAFVTLSGGKAWAINLEGTIVRSRRCD